MLSLTLFARLTPIARLDSYRVSVRLQSALLWVVTMLHAASVRQRCGLRLWSFLLLLIAVRPTANAQVIEYEANGMKYQTATRAGLTVIVTHMASQVAGYGLIQVSISNGGQTSKTVRPRDFSYVRAESSAPALEAAQVIDMLLGKANGADVIKLVSSYEAALYGIPNMRASNGYEQRRQSFMAYGMPARLKAAATASALVLNNTRLAPGQSTDGAIFIPLPHDSKTLSGGHITFRCEGETFDFNPDQEPTPSPRNN